MRLAAILNARLKWLPRATSGLSPLSIERFMPIGQQRLTAATIVASLALVAALGAKVQGPGRGSTPVIAALPVGHQFAERRPEGTRYEPPSTLEASLESDAQAKMAAQALLDSFWQMQRNQQKPITIDLEHAIPGTPLKLHGYHRLRKRGYNRALYMELQKYIRDNERTNITTVSLTPAKGVAIYHKVDPDAAEKNLSEHADYIAATLKAVESSQRSGFQVAVDRGTLDGTRSKITVSSNDGDESSIADAIRRAQQDHKAPLIIDSVQVASGQDKDAHPQDGVRN